jgi:hypothetical protein
MSTLSAMDQLRAADPAMEYLEALWADGEIQARRELRIREDAVLTSEQEDKIHERASELFDRWQAHDQHDRRVQRLMDRNHQDVLDALGEVKQAVDRSAVAANAIDFAQRHPFLAGVFGTLLFGKNRGQ